MAGGNITPQQAQWFSQAGSQFHVNPADLAGIASVETNLGANRATSPTGARGIMQFEPPTAKSVGVNVTDDRSEIFGAAKLLNEYGYQQDRVRAIGAYNGGPGNPQMGYANQVMSEAKRLAGQLSRAAKGASFLPSGAGGNITSSSTNFTGGNVTNAALLSELMRPVSSGSLSGSSLLHAALSDQANSTGQSVSSSLTASGGSEHIGSVRGGSFTPGHGDMNPLGAGWTLGRTDMGVDANAAPGTPIHALNDSKVIQILPNWYAGQPLLLMQLTSGPNAGKYWYVAEQISHSLHVGQSIPKGGVVATYAPHGTGIEIGWGSATAGSRTLAGEQGNTGGPGHANAPAGANFRATELR